MINLTKKSLTKSCRFEEKQCNVGCCHSIFSSYPQICTQSNRSAISNSYCQIRKMALDNILLILLRGVTNINNKSYKLTTLQIDYMLFCTILLRYPHYQLCQSSRAMLLSGLFSYNIIHTSKLKSIKVYLKICNKISKKHNKSLSQQLVKQFALKPHIPICKSMPQPHYFFL